MLVVSQYLNGLPQPGGASQALVTLSDVRGMIEGFLSTGHLTPVVDQDCVILETGARFEASSDLSKLDADDLVEQASAFYEIRPSGLMNLREDRLKELVEKKDIARLCGNTLTMYARVRHQRR